MGLTQQVDENGMANILQGTRAEARQALRFLRERGLMASICGKLGRKAGRKERRRASLPSCRVLFCLSRLSVLGWRCCGVDVGRWSPPRSFSVFIPSLAPVHGVYFFCEKITSLSGFESPPPSPFLMPAPSLPTFHAPVCVCVPSAVSSSLLLFSFRTGGRHGCTHARARGTNDTGKKKMEMFD